MGWIDKDLPGGPRDLIGYGPNPPKVTWPGQARVVVNIVLNYEEGSEYSLPSGDQRNEGFTEYDSPPMDPAHRDLAAESVYEYGSRAGVWRLLRLFDRYDVKVTCFACAVALERNPAVAEWLLRAGHDLCSHGWRWSEYWTMTRQQEQAEMAAALESFQRLTGQRPAGWYSRYGPSANTRELLLEAGGFVYDSDAYNDDLPYFVTVSGQRHLVVPYTKTYNDTRFVLAQGYSRPSDFFETCRQGLDYLWDEGETHPKMMSLGLHARLMGQAARAAALRDWQSFYQLMGTAAATLIGLFFLAISLGVRLVPAQATPAMRAFVTPTVIHFGAVLVLSGLMLVPTYTPPFLGLTLMLAGLVGLGYSGGVLQQMRLHHQQEQSLNANHWLWHLLIPAASYGLTVGTGLGVLLGYTWALNALPLAALALIITGLRNAFDLFLWIARQPA